MRTLNEQIQRLRDVLVDCYNTIKRKGGTIPQAGERNMTNLPDAVRSIPQTHGVLTELNVTANGEYLPADYDADGFSKVTAKFDTSSLPKVKVSTFQVTNDCINADGYFLAELIDTSETTSLQKAFVNCTSLQTLDVSNWNVSKVTDFTQIFEETKIRQIDISNWNLSSAYSITAMFWGCTNLTNVDVSKLNTSSIVRFRGVFGGNQKMNFNNIDVSNWNTRNGKEFGVLFKNCHLLTSLDLSNWDLSNATDVSDMFNGCSSLTSLIGNQPLKDDTCALKGLRISANMFTNGATNIDRDSLRALINGLADANDQPEDSRPTLTLGTTLMVKLTEEDIAIATSKGWSIS